MQSMTQAALRFALNSYDKGIVTMKNNHNLRDILGDIIGAICLFGTMYGLLIIGAALS